jgi:TetR/AcrR family transcriptional repressor of nem operon
MARELYRFLSGRTCDLADSCALQSLSSDVARADVEVKQVFENELRSIIEATAGGLAGKPKARREEATALLAMLVGGVTLARAVDDPAFSKEIAAAVRKSALALGHKDS